MMFFDYELMKTDVQHGRKSSAQWYEIAGLFFKCCQHEHSRVEKRGLFADPPSPPSCPRSYVQLA